MYRERGRESLIFVISLSVSLSLARSLSLYIYIYIERERERPFYGVQQTIPYVVLAARAPAHAQGELQDHYKNIRL